MPRPVSDTKFHVYEQPGTKIWWVWCWRKKPDGSEYRYRMSTAKTKTGALLVTQYDRDSAQALVNRASGVKESAHAILSVEWVKEYMEERILKVEGKKYDTWRHYRTALLAFTEVYGPSYQLAEFRATDVYDFQKTLLKSGRTSVTVNTYCRGMAGIFHRLKRSGKVKENPFDEFERIKEPKKKKHMTRDELRRFLDAVAAYRNHDRARLMFILAHTGMRRSEVLNLSRSDVDLRNNRFQVTNVKSHSGEKRWLSIPKAVRGHFAYFMEHEGERPFAVCKPGTLGDSVREVMDAAGLPYHTHSLRHTYLTLIIESGTSIRNAQHIAGHKDQRTTEQWYAHDSADFYELPDLEI